MSLAVLVAVFVGSAAAQPSREVSRRVVRLFDFEPSAQNPTDLPLGWYRGQEDLDIPRVRPGFPPWNRAVLAGAPEGGRAVRLPTRGGSTSLLLAPGVVGVFPGADYLVRTLVRTDEVGGARAFLAARLLDQEGRPIEGSEVRSAPLQTGGEWRPVAIEIFGDDQRAAFMQIELMLLQPRDFRVTRVPEGLRVWDEDYTGDAWFDDVAVVQLPRVRLTTAKPGELVTAPEPPELSVLVNDLAGERLTVRVEVMDIDGVVVDRLDQEIEGGRLGRGWEPALPGLGWYRAVATVRSVDGLIGATTTDFAWLPPLTSSLHAASLGGGVEGAPAGVGTPDRSRFGLALSGLDAGLLEALTSSLPVLGVGRLSVPLWDGREIGELGERLDLLAELLERLDPSLFDVTIEPGEVPAELAIRTSSATPDLIDMLRAGDAVWGDAVLPALDRFGQRVRRWRTGGLEAVRATERFDPAPEMDETFAALSRLVPGPIAVLGWRADTLLPGGVVGTDRSVSMLFDPGFDDGAIAALADDWSSRLGRVAPGAEPAHLELVFGRQSPRETGLRSASAALARRLALFWASFMPHGSTARAGALAGGSPSVVIADPFRAGGRRGLLMMPRPEAAVLRHAIERLADRRFIEEVRVSPGVRALLFGPVIEGESERGGLLVMWRDAAPARFEGDVGEVEMRLALDSARVFDIFGNESEAVLEPIEGTRVLTHRVAVGREPVFVDGVDVNLVRFQSSLELEPTMIAARSAQLEHELVLRNPWPSGTRGQAYVVAPGGRDAGGAANRAWRISPRAFRYTTIGGGEARLPLVMTVSPAVETGTVEMVFDLSIEGNAEYGLVRVRRYVELGLPGLRLDVSYRFGPDAGGDDVLVEIRITNTGDEAVDLELIARAPGYPRERRVLSALAPGETAIRLLPFGDGRRQLDGRQIFVAVLLADGDGRLTRSIEVLDPDR